MNQTSTGRIVTSSTTDGLVGDAVRPFQKNSLRTFFGEMEICNECGQSVQFGSGRFVNRIPDFNTVEERRAMGKPYPEGDYMCQECEIAIEKDYD